MALRAAGHALLLAAVGKPLIYLSFIACAPLYGPATLREVCAGGIIAYTIHRDHPGPDRQVQGQTRAGVPATAAKTITTGHVA